MEDLLFTFNAILPIILPILLGYFLKRKKFFSEQFLTEGNKLVFKVLLPILLFSNLYLADLKNINWSFVGFAMIAILVLFFMGTLVVMLIPDRKQKGVILQATFRSNYAIIGIPLATMLGGAVAGTEASIVAAVSVPLFNVLAVISLSIYDHEEENKINIKDILYKIITNPLILGVFAGIAFCFIRMGIDSLFNVNIKEFLTKDVKFVSDTISKVGGIATTFALIVLGGKFEFTAVKRLWRQLTLSVSLRLVVIPAIFLTIAYLLSFRSSTHFAILIALFATPIAVSSAPMAAQMGQDDELAGQIVVWTSALSAFSLFIIIFICSTIGIF